MPKNARKQKDIYTGFHFFVEVEGINIAGFSECSGLSIETEVFEYAEGGWNYNTHKMPVRTKYSNITLKRGINPGKELQSWYLQNINGNPKGRKNVTITQYGPDGKETRVFHLRGAFPIKWTGPDLRTDSGAAAIETLEFAHEGLTVMPERK